MKERIEVRSQAEFDLCVKAGNIAVVIGCRVVARENSSVVACGSSSVEAWGNSSVVARENSSVEAWGNSSVVACGSSSVVACGSSSVVARENSSVEAWGNSSVVARENSSVEAWGNSSVEAWGNSSVVARENSSVVACGSSSVVAWENSSVVAWENSSVVAWENSSVEAWENSSVVAWGNSSVEARGNVFIRLWSALKIKASLHVCIMVHGEAESIEGGNQVTVMAEPKTGAEWCEYYGIDPAKAEFVVPNIDRAIYDSIQKNKELNTNGLEMGSWHGKDCNESNWCETTHCRAGYAICLAGKAGFELERKFGPEIAGRMIYAASAPDQPIPHFMDSNENAMADIKRRAGIES